MTHQLQYKKLFTIALLFCLTNISTADTIVLPGELSVQTQVTSPSLKGTLTGPVVYTMSSTTITVTGTQTQTLNVSQAQGFCYLSSVMGAAIARVWYESTENSWKINASGGGSGSTASAICIKWVTP